MSSMLKVFLISAGVLSLAVAVKLSAPVAVDSIPATWSVVMSWLKPPYLYLIINGIIIMIAATSRLHTNQSKPEQVHEHAVPVQAVPLPEFLSFLAQPVIDTVVEEREPIISSVVVYESNDVGGETDVKLVTWNGLDTGFVTEEEKEAGDVFVESKNDDILSSQTKYAKDLGYTVSRQEVVYPDIRQLESLFPAREKSLVTSRFGHGKPNRANPEVPGKKALRVTRPKRHDTLESTWKMISEGRHVPLTRHFRKAETFDQRVTPTTDHLQKAGSFKDRTGDDSSSRVRKEPSLGQDELNRKVETFIKKFNEDMRIQRQESLKQYMEMISRGL